MIAVNVPLPACCMECGMSVWIPGEGKNERILSCQAMMVRVIDVVKRGPAASGLTIEEYEQLRKADYVELDEHAMTRPDGCPIIGEPVRMKMADGRTVIMASEIEPDRRKSGNVVAFPGVRTGKKEGKR